MDKDTFDKSPGFFFLMIGRPPRSTLFPSTTLSRSNNYPSAVECKNGSDVVASGPGTSLANVPVGSADAVVCTITNTRKTGTLTLNKKIIGDPGTDTFNLKRSEDHTSELHTINQHIVHNPTGTKTVNTASYDVGDTSFFF